MASLRLGTVPYLNALPLTEGLEELDHVTLERDVPSQLVHRLRNGSLDAALLSSVELFRNPPLGWVRGPVIASHGPVASILLFLRKPPRDSKTLALDTSSLTASILAQICLTQFLGASPPHITHVDPKTPLEMVDADAVLRIGDPALQTKSHDRDVLDLGEVWTKSTGLPFVYALWLTQENSTSEELPTILQSAKDKGLARAPELAREFALRQDMAPDTAVHYITHHIQYTMGDAEQSGLAKFGQLAHTMGLVAHAEIPLPTGGAVSATPHHPC